LTKCDYAFRYKIKPSGSLVGRGLLHQMIQSQLNNLLNVATTYDKEREVKIDGFRLLNESTINSIFNTRPNDNDYAGEISSESLYEPRIELIKKQLEAILSLVELESCGKAVKVDGFRLRNLEDWQIYSECDPQEIFEYLGTRCNCNCLFCYNKGAPPSLALKNAVRDEKEEVEEIYTRLKYYRPSQKTGLFHSMGSTCEVLAHPHALEVLGLLRQKTGKPFRIATNGAALTKPAIEQLAGLAPVHLDFSLNSASPERRSKLMRDKNSLVAISALPHLKGAGIPYSLVIVPWPFDSVAAMLEDMEKTIAYAAENDVHLVQISLPGYSKYFSPVQLFDREEIWRLIVFKARELREKYCCPIVAMPGIYEENILGAKKNAAQIIGVIKNSPAYLAGLCRGDIIRGIAGININSRSQARDLLSLLQQSRVKHINLRVNRNESEKIINLNLESFSYPYSPKTSTHLGIVFMGTGFRAGYMEKLRELIKLSNAKDVLLLTSVLVRPVLEQSLEEYGYFDGISISVAVPRNNYFGGNIIMGDLLVVDDFIACIREWVAEHKKPDLVVIPSSPFNLSGWGRDLAGRCYLDIERAVDIPVELIHCQTIYD